MSHTPVMLTEALEALQIQTDAWYIDATLGGAGHTHAILKAGGKVFAFDHDQAAIEQAQQLLSPEIKQERLIVVRENFSQMAEMVKNYQLSDRLTTIQGVLFDFGTSTDQLMDKKRGFSFDSDTELDMRMDDRLGVKAKDLLALLSVDQLTDVFQTYGGETHAKKIAQAIVKNRQQGKPIITTAQLAHLIERLVPRHGKLHPATKVFQALRILVNDELDSIEQALPAALQTITTGGRIVTISFHEGEDRLVKTAFSEWEQQQLGKRINQKPIGPSEQEINKNPRARSAKLRIFEKQ